MLVSPSPQKRPSRAERYLASRARFGMKLGLDAMRRLLCELGDPHRCAPALLVAGTNGKGSVVAYVDAGLRASGLRVGRYVSPHLVRVHERIAVNGHEISQPSLDRCVEQVRAAARALVAKRALNTHPTHFEVLTAAAFLHFRARRVDVMVLEVGLGGRLDATNVVDPLVSAIVSVDYDHEEHLGRTLAAIAREKAGILRPGRSTVLGPLRPEASRAIEARARECGARTTTARAVLARRRDGLVIRTASRRYVGVRPLPGAHQETNAIVALRVLEEVKRAGLPIRLERSANAIAAVRWPGRLQELDGDPPLLLDGAHNAAAARALADYLRSRRPFILVFGMMADKDVAAAARSLFPLARRVILTRPRMRRAATPAQNRRRAGAVARGALSASGVASALRLGKKLARPGERIVVSGSLYLVGEVLRLRRSFRWRARRGPSLRSAGKGRRSDGGDPGSRTRSRRRPRPGHARSLRS